MSAIFGLLRLDGREVSAREIGRMSTVLAHRGPDGRHVAIRGAIGMGHALLRVNNEDWHEAQPIEDGAVLLVADLRLDNREQIAAAAGIAADTLAELSDSAVLLAAYRLWGDDVARHLHGDFTFAIWNGETRTLLLGRDAMGQRGLYYHLGPQGIVFASEAKALWAIEGVPRRLSQAVLARRLSPRGEPVAGESLFEGIVCLPGGTTLGVAADGTAISTRYWRPHADPAHLDRDDAYYLRTYRAVMEEVVACRVRRLLRRPALLMSGGFDSGVIAALAGRLLEQQGRTLFCVSSVLPEGETRPNIAEARRAVEAFRRYPFLDLNFLSRRSPTIADLETAFATTMSSAAQMVQRELLALAATSGARLVLDGYGGDYTVHVRAHAMLGRFLRHGAWRRFGRELRARRRATRRSWKHILLADVLGAFVPSGMPGWIDRLRRGESPRRVDLPSNKSFIAAHHPPRAATFAEAGTTRLDRWRARWLEILWRVLLGEPHGHTLAAYAGMDHSRPFHDRRVVELALAIPERLQLRDGLERYLPRRAFADILPPLLLNSGPGNNQIDPDMFRKDQATIGEVIAHARRIDAEGRISRHADLDRIERNVTGLDESIRAHRRKLAVNKRILTLTLFIAWFDATNE